MYAYQNGGQDSQQALLTELYRAHHERKEDIEDFETLSKYAEKIGLMSRQEVSGRVACETDNVLTRY